MGWVMAIEFENKFTIGNVLTVAAMVAGMFWSYSQLQSEQVRQADRLQVLELSVTSMAASAKASDAATDGRVRSLEVAQAAQSSDLRNIQSGINDIKSAIVSLSQKVQK